MTYKGLMVSGVPNFVFTVGYTNASWTLKADLVGEYVVRLLGHMKERGLRSVVAEKDPTVGERPFMDLASGYVQRAIANFPKVGTEGAWKMAMAYEDDVDRLRHGSVVDPDLHFSGPRLVAVAS